LYEYLTLEKGFGKITLEGTQEATGLDANGKKLPANSLVLPWANDVDENGQPRTEFLAISGVVQEGDVVFYRQERQVHGNARFNHAAFVVGLGIQTRKAIPITQQYEPPYFQTPYIVDHSSTFSYLGKRAINDTYSEVNQIVIVHIPDDIPEPEKPWCGCK